MDFFGPFLIGVITIFIISFIAFSAGEEACKQAYKVQECDRVWLPIKP
jgi:hypothetical protein